MSQIFHTPKKTRQRNRAVSHIYKSSTPYKNVSIKQYSISLSGIDTGSSQISSSSTGGDKKRPQPHIPEKRKKTAKKRRVVIRQDSDSEWETRSEESIKKTSDSSSKNIYEEYQDDGPAYCNLFEDPCTPEKVRDAPITYEVSHESPILQSSRRLRLITAKDNLMQREELLPVSNLRLSKSQDLNSDETDDDAPIFYHERDMKTYPVPPKHKKSPEQRSRNFTFRVRFPTATSDLLWDEFVDKFRDEVSQYLASPSKRVPVKLTDSARGLPDVAYSRRRIDLLPPGMKCVSQRYDRATRRWITCSDSEQISSSEQGNAEWQNEPKIDAVKKRGMKTRERTARKRGRKKAALKSVQKRRADVYDQADETDIEFETGGRDKRRISFREFCRKQNIEKIKTPTVSSHSDT